MRTELPRWAPPLLALQLLTRIPAPGLSQLPAHIVQAGLGRAVIWFPLVGTLIGVLTSASLLLAEQLWTRLIAVVIALIVETRLTGAFHEDAVADFCDGVGGGRDPEQVRAIMKDSRIGSFGALGLFLAVALRAALMVSLPVGILVAAIVGAATYGRLLAVVTMATVAPAPGAAGLARAFGEKVRTTDAILAVAIAAPSMAALAWASPKVLLPLIVAGVVFVYWLRSILVRRVGGSTGDCLGFASCAGQILCLLAVLAA